MWDIRWFRGSNNDDGNDNGLHEVVVGSEFYALTQVTDLELAIAELAYPTILWLFHCLQWDCDLWSTYVGNYMMRYWVPESQLHNVVYAILQDKTREYKKIWWLLIGLHHGSN
jgi:hypothetical protein